MCFFLEDNGVPLNMYLGVCAVLSIIVGIYCLIDNTCTLTLNFSHISAPSWLLTRGLFMGLCCSFFCLQRRYFGHGNDYGCFRKVLLGFFSVASLTLMIIGIDIFLQFAENNKMHQNDACIVPNLFMILFMIPSILVQFIFFALLICCPFNARSELVTVREDYGSI